MRSGRVPSDLGLLVAGGGATRRFGREGDCSIRRLGGDALRLGLESRLGGDALRLGFEFRLGGDASRFGLEFRLGGDALRFGLEFRLGGEALRLGLEFRLGGDALRLGLEFRLGGDALRGGLEWRFGGEALRLGLFRDGPAPLLPLRPFLPPVITAISSIDDPSATPGAGPPTTAEVGWGTASTTSVVTAAIVTSLGRNK